MCPAPRTRSRIRAAISERKNKISIGMPSISIENGSVDGVATAAKTMVPITIHGLAFPICCPDTTPARLSSSTKSGISIAIPKTSSIRIRNERYLEKSIRLVTPFGVNEISTWRPLGST